MTTQRILVETKSRVRAFGARHPLTLASLVGIPLLVLGFIAGTLV